MERGRCRNTECQGDYSLRTSRVSVLVTSNDVDLHDLIRYLSRYPLEHQVQLLGCGEKWSGLAPPGGFTGADSAQMDLSPVQTDQPPPAHP
jgi:hypothetical protein